MGNCEECGQWVGFFGSLHAECAARRETPAAEREQAAEQSADRSTDSVVLHRMRTVEGLPAISERDDCITVLARGSKYPSNIGNPRWHLYSLFAPGDPLKLVPEPDNPRDPYAVAVWGVGPLGQELHLGYLPADFAASLSQQELRRGRQPKAWVLTKRKSDHHDREMLAIQIDLHSNDAHY
jgi:HIRAN domain-containing protein